jgi:hypothetical protein
VTLEPRVFEAVPLAAGPGDPAAGGRADIVLSGIEHAGPSYELRVFVNNRDATAATPATPEEGYAGSVYVYGHGATPEHGAGAPAGGAPESEAGTAAGGAPESEAGTAAGGAPESEAGTAAGGAPEPEAGTAAGGAPEPEAGTAAGGAPEPEAGEPRHAARLPVTRYIIATEALRAAAATGDAASITLVPAAFSGPEPDVDLSSVTVSVLVRA